MHKTVVKHLLGKVIEITQHFPTFNYFLSIESRDSETSKSTQKHVVI